MENLANFYFRYLRYIQAKDDSTATLNDKYMALSYAVRSQMVDKWIDSQKRYHEENPRRVYFLSTEYVFGQSLKYNIINMNLEKSTGEAAVSLGFSLEKLFEQESDFDLGNPSKGTIAASMLDSLANLGMPGMGYGLNYDYAFYHQKIEHGAQNERPNDWLHKEHAWEIKRPEYSCTVSFYGAVHEQEEGAAGAKEIWTPSEDVIAVPYDFPVAGYVNNTVNTLRLWSAQASEEFLPDYANHGDYIRACEEKYQSGRITRYLFPDEDVRRSTEMRIKQRYFFVSASLQDIVRRYKLHNPDITALDKKVVIHLNGSSCAIAVVELLRILMDNEGLPFHDAWTITRNVFAYTCFAVSLEQIEKWPLYLMEEVIPRHMALVYAINKWHLGATGGKVRPGKNLLKDLSVIEGDEVKWVRMSHLASLGSRCVNGLSQCQTELLKKHIFPKFIKHVPVTVKNITHGIAVRRWLLCANKPLATFITELIGDAWIADADALERLENFAGDREVKARLGDIKHAAKRRLLHRLQMVSNLSFDANSFLDVDCRRIHRYKRQVLHVLYVLSRYLRIRNGEDIGVYRTHIFAGKASPSDLLAKQIVQLINIAAGIVNADPLSTSKIRVIFIPDYSVSMAERVVAAADLSEQIAAAHREPYSTVGMKYSLNGAVTLAGRCGANIELLKKIGIENNLFFGISSEAIAALKKYRPAELLESHRELTAIFTFLEGALAEVEGGAMINPLLASLRDADPYYVLYDFDDYCLKQHEIELLYKDRPAWLCASLTNIARSGWFSSDRVVKECIKEIWELEK